MNKIKIFLDKPLIIMLLVTLSLMIILEPFSSSLFSGSAWRNTQSFAPYMCFQNSDNVYSFIQCIFAPNLGFDDKAYSGLELPLLPMFDYLLKSNISIYIFQSKMQLLALVLIFVSFISLSKFKLSSLLIISILTIGIIDNPTLYFHILSYQPDLFSIALILFSISLLLQNEKSYIPEILLGMGILFKPQHALIAFLSFLYLRIVYLNHQKYINIDVIKRASLIIGIVVLSLIVGKISQFIGISEKYPSLTAILGGFGQYSDIAFDYFIQMFQRNGLQFIVICCVLFLLTLVISKTKRKNLLVLFGILSFAYIFTYSFFLTGFIVNIYYGIVLSLVFMIIALVSFYEISIHIDRFEQFKFYGNSLLFIILIISLVLVARPKNFYAKILTDRTKICTPENIRVMISKYNIQGIFLLNEPSYEPTMRISIGSGKNFWFQNLDRSHLDLMMNEKSDYYYFTCAHFTKMLKNDTNKYNLITSNFEKIINVDDWIVYKLKKGISSESK